MSCQFECDHNDDSRVHDHTEDPKTRITTRRVKPQLSKDIYSKEEDKNSFNDTLNDPKEEISIIKYTIFLPNIV